MSKKDLRKDAKMILDSALEAVNPYNAVKKAIQLNGSILKVQDREIDLDNFDRIVAVGAGKAGAPMASALEDILGDRLKRGLVVVKDGHLSPTRLIKVTEASHPVPDARGVEAGNRIAELLTEYAGPNTLVFSLISGGGSALLVSPAEGITLSDKQKTTSLLLACGADIVEINTIRKHLSKLKGGGLASLATPSRVVSLIISDVVGDRLDSIASGPTVADHSTWQDCREILTKYDIYGQVPEVVRKRIEKGLAGELPETPKPGDTILKKVGTFIIANNRGALSHAKAKAGELGYKTLVLSSTIEGETKEIARMHTAIAREIVEADQPLSPPCAVITGGETTVNLGDSTGKGGRNQEFALAAALEIAGLNNLLVLSAGTDGTDGPTDAAGAWADGETVERALAKGMKPAEYLAEHDAYNFFAPLKDLVITGPTKTNVMDIRLMLIA
ncbi:glycerate kinase type-2 family protein [Dethiosulfatarculus sandiegensis]|uniref:Glycerate kinase n=1 Tax=Dethiosulfatarculus sandiegensis TaxID=1429043 RepID=A0A0D2JBS4_9BACT|nr:glycerate kinase [Dethiosulfatarculus sandiegensis]KIX15594.1 glycerate kinase [Dethiosulfatarculus sandiegensis]